MHSDYISFLENQTHVSAITLAGMRGRLKHFPPPDQLNASWLRKRMKEHSPYSLRAEKALAKRILLFLGRENDLSTVRLPRLPESVTVEDLYTPQELEHIFQSCSHPRDLAMLRVLYESACREGEMMSMTFDRVTFNDDGTATVRVSGKTGLRETYLLHSVPALKTWMNIHPIGSGPLWITVKRPITPLSKNGFYRVVEGIVNTAGVKGKRRLVHSFRHTRATELVRLGMRGPPLHKLLGWNIGSMMEAVYIHLSTSDVQNEVREKIFGMAKPQTIIPMITSGTCPKCNEAVDSRWTVCEKCGMMLTAEAIMRKAVESMSMTEMSSRMDQMMQVFQAQLLRLEVVEQGMHDLRERIRTDNEALARYLSDRQQRRGRRPR